MVNCYIINSLLGDNNAVISVKSNFISVPIIFNTDLVKRDLS